MINKAILMGRLCADPEFRQTTSGIPVCRFRIAINRPAKKDAEQKADFINVTAWRNTAEFVCRYFTKGKMIIVEGMICNNDYTDNNGVKHYSFEVVAQNVAFGEPKGTGTDAAPAGYQQQPQAYAAPQSAPYAGAAQYATPQQYIQQTAAPQNVPQYGSVPAPDGNPYAQPAPPRAAAPAAAPLPVDSLGEFEAILSDDVPF